MTHPAAPPRVSWAWIAAACSIWVIVAFLGAPPAPRLAPAAFNGEVTMLTDVHDGKYGQWSIGRVDDLHILVEFREDTAAGRGDTVVVSGRVRGEPGMAAGRAYSATLDVRRVDDIIPSQFLPHRAGLWLRRRVVRSLVPYDAGRGLLAGFLIGDTSHISAGDVEAMRRSGLAHFVAVSGSNVAVFLGLLAVISGPLSLGPRRRAVVGLLGLPVFVAATRFEPSVIRASVMAGIALIGRLAGVVLEAWQLLSLAVVFLLLGDPGLTSNVGFQLSVAATAGVLVGARWPARGWILKALAITCGAQLAVAPLLLLHFGSVPLMSPLVNLVAAPLVTAATIAGAVGVTGLDVALVPASWVAEVVLGMARAAAGWPQLGPIALIIGVSAVVVALRARSFHHVLAPLIALAIAVGLVVPNSTLPAGGAAVLDVGQGDAILINGGQGHMALVDGGPDAGLLIAKLRDYGIRHLDLVVLTHAHADHSVGLVGAIENFGVNEVWVAVSGPDRAPPLASVLAAAKARSIRVSSPPPGHHRFLGSLELVVDGPLRRYASVNDQSIVLTVRGASRSMLLTGDIEAIAQGELTGLRGDILKVPHHGGATSDLEWLVGVDAGLAVISVGQNDFGHPAESVVAALLESGTEVVRTDQSGDVVVDLASAPAE